MKYYIYVSDTKVDMLYEQIPISLRNKLAAELKIDLKLLSASFSEKDLDETRFSKLDIVVNYIKKHQRVGRVDQPESYFQGMMDLRWGPLFSRLSGAIYFGGTTPHTILGLGGSLKHVIGEVGSAEAGATSQPMSSTPSLLYLLASNIRPDLSTDSQPSTNAENQQALLDVANVTKTMQGPSQRLEFLAKRLLDSEGPAEIRGLYGFSKKRVLLGTPIYVALAA